MTTGLSKLCASVWRNIRRKWHNIRGRFIGAFSRRPERLAAMDETRRANASIVVDLFAAIMSEVEGVGMEDMDTTMDMLRYDFPNVEHSWLAERFQEVYTAKHPLAEALAIACAGRTEPERVALSLQILTMLYRVGGDLTNPSLLDQVTNGLNLPGYSSVLERLVSTPGAQADLPIESLEFSQNVGEGIVTLGTDDADVRFRVLSCVNILLVVNDGLKPLLMRGRILHKGDMQILYSGQNIRLNSGILSYSTIRALLQSRYTGAKLVAYLVCKDGEVSVTRYRQKHSLAKLRFGVHVEFELLQKNANIILDGIPLADGCQLCTTYYTPFTVEGLGPYTLAELHNIESPGKSFQLAPENRKVLVTNLPYVNKPGVVMLSPGLAPGLIFEVSYTRTGATGNIRLIEGSRHALTLDGAFLRDDTPIYDGALIMLSPVQYLRCRFSAGVLDEETSLIQHLRVRGLTRDFVGAGRVVDNIDFFLKRGEMACILGPSGSGKSTILNMLAGHLEPSFGSIHYNNERLSPHAQNLRRHIAFIPREDILDEAMTVGEHVYHASVSRRPRLTRADRIRRVNAVLNFVGMGAMAGRQVGRRGERALSDGERTRLNLALDLTGTAEVFLIDEPISGLSSADAEKVIQTLEKMASGRLLLCTLHRPSQSILNRFSKVMVLNSHGQMAFWGTPRAMVEYFENAAREMGLYVSREAIAAGGAEYAFEVMSAPFSRLGNYKVPNADMWQEYFEKHQYSKKQAPEPEAPAVAPHPYFSFSRRSVVELWRLFMLWVTRTFLSRIRSRMSLYALLLEAPVLALLIAGTLRASGTDSYIYYESLHISEYLFLSLVLAMFFGLTNAACEVIRDRALIRRESNYKLFITGYLLAKTLVLTGIAAIQCALYLWVSNSILEIELMFWPHFGIMLLTSFVGIALSLMVSSLVRAERTALNIVPLLLVPQILLAGALIRFEEMNEFCPDMPEFVPDCLSHPLSTLRHRVAYQDAATHAISSKPVPLIAEFCPLRYAFEIMFVTQVNHNLWEVELKRMEKQRENLRGELTLLKQQQANIPKDTQNDAIHKDLAERISQTNDKLKLVNNALLLTNSGAADARDAKDILRLSRKVALTFNEELMEALNKRLENGENEADYPVEFYFSNKKLAELGEGVNLARKDNRISENRGFFLSPRQPIPFGGMDQHTEEGSVSTIYRNSVYLFLMGLCPILVAAWRLRKICRSN
ncbi:MAG: ATP-binding cassette domain-containing protein [Akkermansia sp.]|nr:ATP-binding cassette domain-containing protein [Akkermansia sp.]